MALMFKLLTFVLILLVTGVWIGANYLGVPILTWVNPPAVTKVSQATKHWPAIPISLTEVARGFSQPTDLHFIPGSTREYVVLQKQGKIIWGDFDGNQKTLARVNVLTRSEQGLLGIAFEPDYPKTPCAILNYVASDLKGKAISRVARWCHSRGNIKSPWTQKRVLFEVAQPYANHNAGHLLFDRSGNLIVPWGDGGSGHDPLNHGQNRKTYLGSIIRIKPTDNQSAHPYLIPKDNPFIHTPSIPNEVYATGFRNPWRIALDQQNRIIVADVGQDRWEEINIVKPGGNYGWNIMEGFHCLYDGCDGSKTLLPIAEYGHDVGRSITGGYVYESSAIPALQGKYIFGDYVSGQIMAINIPKDGEERQSIITLGQWPVFAATFGRSADGRIYIVCFARGVIYRIDPPKA